MSAIADLGVELLESGWKPNGAQTFGRASWIVESESERVTITVEARDSQGVTGKVAYATMDADEGGPYEVNRREILVGPHNGSLVPTSRTEGEVANELRTLAALVGFTADA